MDSNTFFQNLSKEYTQWMLIVLIETVPYSLEIEDFINMEDTLLGYGYV